MQTTLYLATGTRNAYGFMRRQRNDASCKAHPLVWLPKSQVKLLATSKGEPWKWAETTVELPDWLAEQKGLS